MAVRKHSRIGASSAKRWLNCPGSVRMQRDKPDTSSEAADEGTAAHDLAEKALKENKKAVAYLGMTIKVENTGREFVVDEEMVESVQLYIDTIQTDRAEMGAGVKGHVEKMFHLESINKELFGTNDASLVQPQAFGWMKVYDLKYGAGVAVEVEKNEQMMIYALGALEDYPDVEDVEIIIVQPRKPHSDGLVRRFQIPADELRAWGQEVLKPGAEAALKEDAPVHAGDWCRWCKAMATCPAIVDQAQSLAKVAFDDPVFPAPAEMDLDQLAKVIAFSKMFSSWAKEVESYARAQLDRGVKVPGWKLVRGKKSRSWADNAAAETAMVSLLGDAAMTEPELKSVAQAEKELKIRFSKKEVEAKLDPFVRIDQGLTMASAEDNRPEVLPAIEVFNDGGPE